MKKGGKSASVGPIQATNQFWRLQRRRLRQQEATESMLLLPSPESRRRQAINSHDEPGFYVLCAEWIRRRWPTQSGLSFPRPKLFDFWGRSL